MPTSGDETKSVRSPTSIHINSRIVCKNRRRIAMTIELNQMKSLDSIFQTINNSCFYLSSLHHVVSYSTGSCFCTLKINLRQHVQHLFVSCSTRKIPSYLANYPNVYGSEWITWTSFCLFVQPIFYISLENFSYYTYVR